MFKIEEFDIKLDTEVIGRNFLYCEEIDSTNSVILEDEYDKAGMVILAEYQTHGKGRKRREWLSNRGQNLTFSILVKNLENPNSLNLLNLGASLAVSQSLENLFQLKTNLKWPNDVLVDGKKICGILTESVSKGGEISKAAIGIGLNVNQPNFVGKFAIEPTSIRKELKTDVSREKVLSEVLNNFENIFKTVLENPQKIIHDWKQKSRFLGENVKIVEDDKTTFGKFVDLDENGFMVLETAGETKIIHFGDVSLR